jgi:hypothetical protein
MPAVPFLQVKCEQKSTKESLQAYLDTHGVDVDLLVEVVEESNCLDHHSVNLVRRELDLEPGKHSNE